MNADHWIHLAAVVSQSSMRLYGNGVLFDVNTNSGLASLKGSPVNMLGGEALLRFAGQMDEVRMWKVARTEKQIRQDMFQGLTGNEPGLIGLWNFDDPAQPWRDASPNAHHGSAVGQATTVQASLHFSLLSGRITDPAGRPLAGASLEVRRSDGETQRVQAPASGEYAILLSPSERCDLFVTTGVLSAYRPAERVGSNSTGRWWTLRRWPANWVGL